MASDSGFAEEISRGIIPREEDMCLLKRSRQENLLSHTTLSLDHLVFTPQHCFRRPLYCKFGVQHIITLPLVIGKFGVVSSTSFRNISKVGRGIRCIADTLAAI